MISQGMRISDISRKLNCSRQWVHKWKDRQAKGSDHWNESLSRAPLRKPGQTPEPLERMVVETRTRLESSPYMESGAYAIWHEMKKRGVEPPSVATINRILGRHGMTQKRVRYVKSGIDYPEMPLFSQMMDLIGPRYLRGGHRFYLMNIICNETRHAGVYPILSKSGEDITHSVLAFWKSYTVPDYLQMDNELSFRGSNRHPRGLGLLLRTALSLNVTPRFIPVGEPWRNGVIERFNQKVEKTLLMQEHDSFDELLRHSSEFVEVHNNSHHYSTMGHKTPAQMAEELGLPAKPLEPDFEVTGRPELDACNLNEIHFIRLVRSDLSIDVLNTEIQVTPELTHAYVEAVLLINEHQLQIRHNNQLYQTVEFLMPTV